MTDPMSESVTFRLTAGEKAALEELAKRRAAEMDERGEVPDASTTGLLRTLIRREAKAAGVSVGAPAPPAPPPKASKKAKPAHLLSRGSTERPGRLPQEIAPALAMG